MLGAETHYSGWGNTHQRKKPTGKGESGTAPETKHTDAHDVKVTS